MDHRLSEKWIKASVAGTIWAASEIVLGSFLHNLRIPFSGNILTAIGIIILISISYIWTEKGLFWRAGLICAILKTMSPSAVIFGPMLAILAEAVLLESSVRIFGRTIAGFVVGAMLAMSWNLLQKILNMIIFYGSGIVEIYTGLLKMAQKQLNIQTDIVWVPILVLLAAYALFGILAAVLGIKTGRRMHSKPVMLNEQVKSGKPENPKQFSQSSFDYSVRWLAYNVLVLLISFFLINLTSWYIWAPFIVTIIIIWALRYKRALRQLSKPGFWIFFFVITFLTAFVFADNSSGGTMFEAGLLAGIQMNFRAVAMIVGFSVIGTELYNPVIRSFFLNTSFRNLPLAIELSVESLPDFIASIPDFKSVMKDPVSIFHNVLSHAEKRFSEIIDRGTELPSVIIITGAVGEGKTSFVRKLAADLKNRNIVTDGIITERITENNITTGYDLVHIGTGDRMKFLRQSEECGTEVIGRFKICPEGIDAGRKILGGLEAGEGILIIIDEVGLLELEGRGWSDNITRILSSGRCQLLMTVRTSFIDDIRAKWSIMNCRVFNAKETDSGFIFPYIKR
jgi:nucleoside-triphosphatase THEP1